MVSNAAEKSSIMRSELESTGKSWRTFGAAHLVAWWGRSRANHMLGCTENSGYQRSISAHVDWQRSLPLFTFMFLLATYYTQTHYWLGSEPR